MLPLFGKLIVRETVRSRARNKVEACANNHQCSSCPFRRDSVLYNGVKISGSDYSMSPQNENQITENIENLKIALTDQHRPETPFTCHNENNRQCRGAARVQGFWHGPEIELVPNKYQNLFEKA